MQELPFDKEGLAKWLETMPQNIKDLVEKYPPWFLYRDAKSGYRAVITAYGDHGTVTCQFLAQFNLIDFEREVHGMDPTQLTLCDFPSTDEKVGLTIAEGDVKDYIAIQRCRILAETWAELQNFISVSPGKEAELERFSGMVRLTGEYFSGVRT